jgi:hypothetical protein
MKSKPKSNDTEATRRKSNLPVSEQVREVKPAPTGTTAKIASANRNGNPKLFSTGEKS